MSEMQAQCWICPQCYDDKNHIPGDKHCLQEQKREAMAIARLNQLESRKLQEQLTAAQSEIEALRAQLSDVTGCACDSESLCKYHSMVTTSGRATVLRKQAEALDNEASEWREDGRTNQIADDIAESAQRLRQQADELEKAGGGQ